MVLLPRCNGIDCGSLDGYTTWFFCLTTENTWAQIAKFRLLTGSFLQAILWTDLQNPLTHLCVTGFNCSEKPNEVLFSLWFNKTSAKDKVGEKNAFIVFVTDVWKTNCKLAKKN